MSFIPKRTKFRKTQKGRITGVSVANTKLGNGIMGLKALEIGRKLKKTAGKLWINIFPHIPVTSKAVGVRMGKGKGAVDYWTSQVRPGQIVLEISGVSPILAKNILLKASFKLPIRTKIISR